MVVDTTLYVDESSARKQLTMPAYAVSALKQGSAMTKGLVANEVLLLAGEARDALSCVEDDLYDNLENEACGDVRGTLRETVEANAGAAKNSLHSQSEYGEVERIENVNVHLPPSILDGLPGRGLGDLIADSVVFVVASPWSSRMDRIVDLRALLVYARSGDAPSDASDFVRDVAEGESGEYDVGPLHEMLSPEVAWWEQESLTLSTLRERADDVTMTPEARSTALENALKGGVNRSYDEMVDLAIDIWGCGRSSAKGYADRVNLGDQFRLDYEVVAKVSELADEAREMEQNSTGRTLSGADWKVLGLRGPVDDVDGTYEDSFEAAEAISLTRQKLKNQDDIPVRSIKTAQSIFTNWLDKQHDVIVTATA